MKETSIKVAIIGVVGILLILLSGVLLFNIDIIVLMLLSMIYLGAVGSINGFSIDDVVDGMKEGISQGIVGLLFFLLIGGIIGIWIQSGTVPALVYYGLEILNPNYFLITSFIICSIVSSVMGTSWGTVGTVGIAIMGVALSSGITIPVGIIAGSIVAGSWFGDKMSPISDSTVLTATASGADIYKHIKVMMYSSIPSYIITLGLFALLNMRYVSDVTLNQNLIISIKDALSSEFYIGIWVFIPVIILVIASVLRINAIKSLLLAIGAGIVCSIIFQGNSISEALNGIMVGGSIDSSVAEVNTLINRGGIASMQSTFTLGFVALCLGGVLQKMRYLHIIIETITKNLKSCFSIVLTTMFTCTLGNAVFADNYLTIVLNANMYNEVYKKRGMAKEMLSRVIEEAATMTNPLIPWTAASAFIVGALGVPTEQYAMFALLNIINPLVSLLLTFFKIGIVKVED